MKIRMIITGLACAAGLAFSVPAAMAGTSPTPPPGFPPVSGAPLAGGCVTGPFDLAATPGTGYNATGEGHNNPVQMQQGGNTDFCLQSIGGGWYAFEDLGILECLNMGTNGTVYEDGCSGFPTTEQWSQNAFGAHHWQNRHNGNVELTGGDGGPPYGSAVFTLPPCTGILCSSQPFFQTWATPGS